MIGQKKTVGVGKGATLVNWTVLNDVNRQPEKTPHHKEVGVNGFDFNNKSARRDSTNKCMNFIRLLKHLWPGNLKEYIGHINTFIRMHDLIERKKS